MKVFVIGIIRIQQGDLLCSETMSSNERSGTVSATPTCYSFSINFETLIFGLVFAWRKISTKWEDS